MKTISFILIFLFISAECNANSQNQWDDSLHNALKGVTRLRICSGGGCDGNPDAKVESLEIHDNKAIAAFIERISFDPDESGLLSACIGDPILNFYKGDKIIVSLAFMSDRILRWLDGKWEGDGWLTEESVKYLVCWFDEHGVKGPKKNYENSLLRHKQARESEEKWLAAMPSSMKHFWNPTEYGNIHRSRIIQEMNAALSVQFPDRAKRILALLEWFGSGGGPWSGFPAYEENAEELLFLYETKDILSSINDTELTHNQVEGAARFFGGWAFSHSRPDDLALLPVALKRKLLDRSLKSDSEYNRSMAQRAFGEKKAESDKR